MQYKELLSLLESWLLWQAARPSAIVHKDNRWLINETKRAIKEGKENEDD